MSKTTTTFSETEKEKLKGLNNGMGYAIIKTSRLNDLQLCGRQDIKGIPMYASVFGRGHENSSVVIRLAVKETAIAKVAGEFPDKALRVAVYLTNELSANSSITEQLRTASE